MKALVAPTIDVVQGHSERGRAFLETKPQCLRAIGPLAADEVPGPLGEAHPVQGKVRGEGGMLGEEGHHGLVLRPPALAKAEFDVLPRRLAHGTLRVARDRGRLGKPWAVVVGAVRVDLGNHDEGEALEQRGVLPNAGKLLRGGRPGGLVRMGSGHDGDTPGAVSKGDAENVLAPA
jgi:hypothetical protein